MTHSNPNTPERTAHAPYNFIPLPDKVIPAQQASGNDRLPSHDRYYPDRYSGTIVLEIETKSPLYTRTMLDPESYSAWAENPREMMRDDAGRETYARFFNHGDVERPVIPGTTLRGMLRAIVEIITYSKVDWVTERKLVYRAVGDRSSLGDSYRESLLGRNQARNPDMRLEYPLANVKGGYLRKWNGEYYIQPAQEFLGETFIHVDYAQANPVIGHYGKHQTHDVYVLPARRSLQNHGRRGPGNLSLHLAVAGKVMAANGQSAPAGWVRAKLVETGQMGRYPATNPDQHPKHMHCAVYDPAGPLPQPGEDVPASWLPVPRGIWELYQEDLGINRERNNTPREITPGEPLFYLVDAAGSLIFFGPTMMFRLPYNQSPRDFVPPELRQPEDIDFVDAIFGYVRDEEMPAGIPQHFAGRLRVGDAKFKSAVDGIWLSPEPVTLKILSGPKPTTFQHYLEQSAPDERRNLRHYASRTPEETKIRGNKLYWHRGIVSQAEIEDLDVNWATDTQHTQVKPVKAGVEFESVIAFDNLSAEELGALMWALKLPDRCCHKLGMGKPLGLGAVKIKPTLHLNDRFDRYERLFDGDGWNAGKDSEPVDFVGKFEEHMTAALGGMGKFGRIERIQMLLKMLEFPGPAKGETEYQELGEFRDRPVLPDPLHVAGQPGQGAALPQVNREPPRQTGTPAQVDPQVDQIVTAIVIDDSNPAGLWTKIAGYDANKYIGFIAKKDTLEKQYKEGAQVRCQVTAIEPDGSGVKVLLKVAPRNPQR